MNTQLALVRLARATEAFLSALQEARESAEAEADTLRNMLADCDDFLSSVDAQLQALDDFDAIINILTDG